MPSIFLSLAAFSAFFGVCMGAFGAHALKSSLNPDELDAYRTAVNYQMWHAVGLLGVAWLRERFPDSQYIRRAGWLMFCGIMLFSGSLYLLAIFHARWLGFITPIGGLAFLAAWLMIALFSLRGMP